MPLNPQRQRFVDEYLVDLSPSRASIRAGYSAKTAPQIGQNLIKRPDVKAAIAEAMAHRAKRTHISQDRVLRELARIAFADIRDTVEWSSSGISIRDSWDISDDAAAAISEVSETRTGKEVRTSVKLRDKMGALAVLSKHLGIGLAPVDEDDGSRIADDVDPEIQE
ncbi:terminase small subunit [Acidisoma cellulosilytica]|uniref:Terminase small subunit n=1 Tax=Acidisoma cellulosilyticum TaxID=2802395 RepID=A0A963Z321_9PROT|nr:terminase small subunit [Acidisoma cellulosilyticum]MCB8881691.1 terminase small subunit [Acidisoma cellulosilyticum]